MKKYKPTPKFKILTAYWWNPFFWLGIILAPFIMFIYGGVKLGFYDTLVELWDGLKNWDLK